MASWTTPSTDLRGGLHDGPDQDRTSWGHVLFRTNPSPGTHFNGSQSLAGCIGHTIGDDNTSRPLNMLDMASYPTPRASPHAANAPRYIR